MIIKNNTYMTVTLHIDNNTDIELLSNTSYNHEDINSIMVISCLGSCVIIPKNPEISGSRIRFINKTDSSIYAHEDNGNAVIENK